MLRTRVQGEDSMFRWARTEMKREIVMSQSSYAKVAGLQSEAGRVVVTRVAGSELEYKRVLSMYRKDMTCSVNNIRREQIKMKLRMGRYAKKLRQTKLENAKRLKEEQRIDKERAALEELHLRLKMEAARKPTETNKTENEVQREGEERRPSQTSLTDINLSEGPVYLQTGIVNETEEEESASDTGVPKNQKRKSRIENRPFSPILPMIDEDAEEKEHDAVDDVDEKKEIVEDDATEASSQTGLVVPQIITDETMSVSSNGVGRKKKKGVSFSDIIKLKYSGTKHLFDLVHTLAKRHGIPDVVEKVPDPRDNIVLRGSTNDSLRLQAAVLYPMKYGYDADDGDDVKEAKDLITKSPTVSNNITESDSDANYDSDISEEKPRRHRKLSLEQRRAIYLSGKHSKSVNDGDEVFLPELGDNPEKYTRRKHKDRSLPELAEKVSKIKQDLFDRSSDKFDSAGSVSGSGSLSPIKPSSSRSSRSLPAALKHTGKADDKVSWTQAFGLLRAIHSLENIS